MVDRTGFEPVSSAMPTLRNTWVDQKSLNSTSTRVDPETLLPDFQRFLQLNMRLESRTVRDTLLMARRFLSSCSGFISYDAVARYLEVYSLKAPKTYNSQITGLRRLLRDYMGIGFIMSFRMGPQNPIGDPQDLSREQVKEGFERLDSAEEKALYLFTAVTGLRKGEILNLTLDDMDFEMRAVFPRHDTRKKKAGVTFFNSEAEQWLQRYLQERQSDSPKVFPISERSFREIWRKASGCGVRITAQGLRAWFSTEMGERGVPDRFVDVFQGRAPRTVIAKYYTGRALRRLWRIYRKAGLWVLS